MAKQGINHPITVTLDTNKDYIDDVGQQFYMIFMSGCVLNAVSAFQSLCACFTSRKWATCTAALAILCALGSVIYLVLVTWVRFRHAGRVCSGDYLYQPLTLETRELGILGLEGKFLSVYVVAGWTQYLMFLIVLVIN